MQPKPFFTATLLLFFGVFAKAQTIDSLASEVSFSISNTGLNTVHGTIRGMAGKINFNADKLGESSLEACVAPNTIDTGIKLRYKDLKGSGFFEVDKFPAICFTSSSIEKTDAGFLAKGTLTMHGISKAVEIPFTFTNKTFTGNFDVNRLDFNVGPNGGFFVGKTVAVKIICVTSS